MTLTQQVPTSAEEAARALVERISPGPEFSRALILALSAHMEESGDEWLTPGEFAKATGYHVNSVTNWAQAGLIRHTRYPSGRCKGVHVSEVARAMRDASTPTPEETPRAVLAQTPRIGPAPVTRRSP